MNHLHSFGASMLLCAHLWGLVNHARCGDEQSVHSEHDHVPEEPSPSPPIETAAVATLIVSGTMEIRTGDPPADLLEPDQGLLLACLTKIEAGQNLGDLSARNFTGIAKASGEAGHFRVKDVSGNTVFQGKITGPDEGGDLMTSNGIIVTGGTVAISLG